MKSQLKALSLILCGTSIGVWAYGAELTLRSRTNDGLRDFSFSQMASSASVGGGKSNFTIKVSLSCYGTNLRSVMNPISPMGTVKMNFGIGPNSDPIQRQGAGDFAVVFPGWLATTRSKDPALKRMDPINLSQSQDLKGGVAFGVQNMIIIRPPGSVSTGITTAGGATYSRDASLRTLHYISFQQDIQERGTCYGNLREPRRPSPLAPWPWLDFLRPTLVNAGGGYEVSPQDNLTGVPGGAPLPKDQGFGQPTCTSGPIGWNLQASQASGYFNNPPGQYNYLLNTYPQFMGHDGPLTGEWSGAWSSDFHTLNISAKFPGELTICGGYFSPLMLFFDQGRPHFTARTDFKIHPMSLSTYWPEAGSPGYFLVLDLNGNGKVDDGTELFGEDPEHKNGFYKLSDYDLNRDGVIDSRDAVFRKLKLWRDTTGTGQSRPQDLHSLFEMGVIAIDLKYDSDNQVSIDNRARLGENSTFVFKKNGHRKKGEIIDVWLAN